MKGFNYLSSKAFWETHRGSYHSDRYAKALINLVRKYIGLHILDAGAGSGSLVRALKNEKPQSQVIGIDVAPKSSYLIKGDLRSLPFSSGYFDTLFSVEVLEHLSEEETYSIFREFFRVLIAGGYLIVSTPYKENLEEKKVACPYCGAVFHRWGHQQSFGENGFEKLAVVSGLSLNHIIPVKMSRLARFGRLGAPFFRSKFYSMLPFKGKGKLNLIMVAQKTTN